MVSLDLFGHYIRISKLRLRLFSLSLYGLSYSHSGSMTISSRHVKFGLQVPKIPTMNFIIVTVFDYDYCDKQHHVSLSKLHMEVHLFPVTPETFINIVLNDFRAQVMSSKHTPPWLQTLRRNLIRTVLNGEYFRLDDLYTKIIFCTRGMRGATRDPDPSDDIESVFTLKALNWHIKGARRRLYKFASIDGQFRRPWDTRLDRGTLVFIAKGNTWTLSPDLPLTSPKRGSPADPVWLIYLYRFFYAALLIFKAFFFLPIFLIQTIHDPASALTIHIPRLDVTVHHFHLRDAELLRQLLEAACRKYELLRDRDEMDIKGFVQDIITTGVLGVTKKGTATE
ncbi:hypothetical protein H0H87_006498 [Tephrocybe sp. NHM501043]|nr:hypothetical protein H0H87_006498 [Tephrocybe sp. NHM501043]